MKKILGLAAVAVMFTSSMFAFGFKAVGARLGANFGAGTKLAGDYTTYDNNTSKKGGNVGFDIGAYAMFDITQFDFGTLYLQPELLFNFNNGYHTEYYNGLGSAKIYTHTLDLPVLVTLQVPLGKMFEVGGGLGLEFSLPLKADGDITILGNTSKLSSGCDKLTAKPNFGMVIDANGKVFFGEKKNIGAVLDMRYTLDFTKTKFRFKSGSTTLEGDVFTRRFLTISAGAEYRF